MTTAAAVMATTAMAFCCSDDCQVYSPSQVNHDKQMHRWLTAHLKTQRSYVPLCGHTTLVQLTPSVTMTIIDKIIIHSNDVNETQPSVRLLANNKYSMLLCHKVVNDCLRIRSTAGLKTFMQ